MIPFRCRKCEELLADATATECACGGGVGATFGLRLGAPGAAPPDSPVAPPREARRIPAGSRLTGELLLRAPTWAREGVVSVTLVCMARGFQKQTNDRLYDRPVELARGPLDEHGGWPFALEVPAFPPSHDGFVEIDWYLRATLTPPKGPATTWTWQLHVLPGAGTPARERAWNRLAHVAARARFLWERAFALGILGTMVAFPLAGIEAGDVGMAVVAGLISAFLAWYAGGWLLDELRRTGRYLRGWLAPRPDVARVLRIGAHAPLRADPRCEWALVRVEEVARRVQKSGASGLYWKTEWPEHVTAIASGHGAGTIAIPGDAPPSITTWRRRIRYELRAWRRGDPEAFHPYYVEILSERSPDRAEEVEPSRATLSS